MSNNSSASEPDGAKAKGAAVEWRDSDRDRSIPFLSALREDVIAHVPLDQRQRSTLSWAKAVLKLGVESPGFQVTLAYRCSHTLVTNWGRTGRVLAGAISRATNLVHRSSIAPRARLHGGLVLPHPQGVMIGSEVVVGPRTWIYHNVTMGGTVGKRGEPTVGADCRLYTGAVLSGPITIGDSVVVSPNSLVQRSVPGSSMAVGVPANVFPKFSKPK